MAHETILIVDDSSDIVEFLGQYVLVPSGYKVTSAADGQSGLNMALKHSPDLIMLDMSMPRMDGMEVLTALRRAESKTPVIFMTMHGSETIAVEAFRLGVRDYLVKPFTIEEVQRAVDHALQETRLTREKEELTRNLIAAETVRQTVITLSHYINNYMVVLTVGLDTLQKELVNNPNLLKIAQDGSNSVAKIEAVLRVLQQVTEVQRTTYHDKTHMIDIEAALREELKRVRGGEKRRKGIRRL
jgi:DNA-binding response OmpR family regulator